ncbi:hypothetical protein RHECIAT_PB0000318 (plasmid) [Rhizobium etli CIAT 652]|uniref:Uncharacterized protein n=1 Tax=Rhizobium etli (strain CIAT 652) TaxID=491916 RepID=B3Q2W8_RHIE6|nr:hypothetical protein RHECIAT_PB0000318 [Rhizobium etli CIAT 652]
MRLVVNPRAVDDCKVMQWADRPLMQALHSKATHLTPLHHWARHRRLDFRQDARLMDHAIQFVKSIVWMIPIHSIDKIRAPRFLLTDRACCRDWRGTCVVVPWKNL